MLDITLNLNHPINLYYLVKVLPGLEGFMETNFSFITRQILINNLKDPDLYRYVFAIVTAHSVDSQKSMHCFLKGFLDKEGVDINLPDSVPRTTHTLYYMAEVVESVRFYLHYARRLWGHAIHHRNYGMKLPLATKFSVRTALLRIQLYTELFHQPLDNSGAMNDWDTDIVALREYWNFFQGVEHLRQCKFIYKAITVSVSHEVEHKRLRFMEDGPDRLCLRGLPQMRRFMRDYRYTEFGLNYVRRLMKRDTDSIETLDPVPGLWNSTRAVHIIFRWDDGPHGGLGITKKHRFPMHAVALQIYQNSVSVEVPNLEDDEPEDVEFGEMDDFE